MTSDTTHSTQLMLAVEAGDGAAERLSAVLASVAVASVIVVPGGARPLVAAEVAGLVAAGQGAGVAMLIGDDWQLARTVRADGVHIGYAENITEKVETARAVLGGRGLIGADAGRSRHDAMTLGELGVDYVAFGVPHFVKDRTTAFERQQGLIAWWAEIFEVPCVATDVAGAEPAGALADAGADFVCLTLGAGIAPAEAASLAREWIDAISRDPGRRQ